jgi:hypothetical protein
VRTGLNGSSTQGLHNDMRISCGRSGWRILSELEPCCLSMQNFSRSIEPDVFELSADLATDSLYVRNANRPYKSPYQVELASDPPK